MYIKNYIKQVGKNVIIRFPKRIVLFIKYIGELIRFKTESRKRKRMPARFRYAHPCLNDRIKTTPVDQHYIYHPAWAARILSKTKPVEHVDISSITHFGTIISAFVPVRFYDYRPAELTLSNYEAGFADLKNLPFENDSIASLSCMHTVEHIGLGRYGDELDVNGDLKAITEIIRVLQPGGNLLFATPVGKPKTEFNAHRIYSYEQIIEYFASLSLKEFSLIPDAGGLIINANPVIVKEQHYGCGCNCAM